MKDCGALSGGIPIPPESVQRHLESKFGNSLEDVFNTMLEPAKSLPPSQLAEEAYTLFERFSPEIPPVKKMGSLGTTVRVGYVGFSV